jgi:hypothetical protein
VRLHRVAISLALLAIAACGLGKSLDDLSNGVRVDGGVVDGSSTPIDAAMIDATSHDGSDAASNPQVDSSCGADLTTDKHNCGACGHDCLGGDCAESMCQPMTFVYPMGGEPKTLLIADDSALYTNSPTYFVAIPYDGGAQTQLFKVLKFVVSAALDSTSVYFADTSDGYIRVVPKVGGTAATIFARTSAGLVTVDDSRVFWASGTALYASPKDAGADATPTTLTNVLSYPQAIAEDTANIYVLNSNGPGLLEIPKSDVDAANPARIDQPAYRASIDAKQIVTDGIHVFWIDENVDAIDSYEIASPFMPASIAMGYSPQSIALDDDNVYFTNDPGGASLGSVCRVSKNGGAVTTIATGQLHPATIAVSADSVFWIIPDDSDAGVAGHIERVAK